MSYVDRFGRSQHRSAYDDQHDYTRSSNHYFTSSMTSDRYSSINPYDNYYDHGNSQASHTQPEYASHQPPPTYGGNSTTSSLPGAANVLPLTANSGYHPQRRELAPASFSQGYGERDLTQSAGQVPSGSIEHQRKEILGGETEGIAPRGGGKSKEEQLRDLEVTLLSVLKTRNPQMSGTAEMVARLQNDANMKAKRVAERLCGEAEAIETKLKEAYNAAGTPGQARLIKKLETKLVEKEQEMLENEPWE